ncbi:RNA 2',3'-cyclic phosphodiesterase [Pseudohalioglobus lutimaris]|uniref:RNA 2',3'-cyclic phosphodiesterase n=1 Tax=Pseudohalioglobus lutimaris TaxID=1737061 RepID=A0A2N5X5N5_9GAMM|nr:RNA 2',3'-cyclic phosphodiesterase [Pseudohalioglobus lutimaris]PLW69797.1 RNA 2',3'-cyclic phosphodiesterase [Pseudohalioglobus lutimaris]
MRLFFALLPGPDLAREIADWRERSISADGRPVPLANLHITLAFLGELSHHRLDPLCQAADELLTAPGLHLQTLRLNATGYWPRPGILWLGPSRWEGALANLAGQLQSRGALAGGKGKRGAYRPHLTLFRGCDQPPPAPLSAPDFSFDCSNISLLQSSNGRQGVHYSDVANWRLSP